MWDQLTIGYLAGIIEGEGSIQFNKSGGRKTPCPKVCVGMTDFDTIQRVKELSGMGYITGPTCREGCLPIWHWTVYQSNDVARLLGAISPIMSERRREVIMEAAELLSIRSKPRPCEHCNDLMFGKMLNARFCGIDCRRKADYARNKDRQKAYRIRKKAKKLSGN